MGFLNWGRGRVKRWHIFKNQLVTCWFPDILRAITQCSNSQIGKFLAVKYISCIILNCKIGQIFIFKWDRVMYIFSAENSYFLQVEPTWNKRDHCDFFFGVMGLNVIFLKGWKMNASFGKITYRKKLIVDFIKYYLTRRSIWLNSLANRQMVSILGRTHYHFGSCQVDTNQ